MAPKVWHRFYDFETGQFTPEFTAFEDAMIGEGADNFGCEDVALAMVQGLTPAEAAQAANEAFEEERRSYRVLDREYAMHGDHDHSMDS